jgi:putative endonuclease
MSSKNFGDIGEDIAYGYLETQGYKILEHNYRFRIGEIDIIAEEGDTLVFIEVKTKSNKDFGLPQEMVNYKKQQKLIRLAQAYLTEKNLSEDKAWRIDVVAITKNKDSQNIQLIRNAIEV